MRSKSVLFLFVGTLAFSGSTGAQATESASNLPVVSLAPLAASQSPQLPSLTDEPVVTSPAQKAWPYPPVPGRAAVPTKTKKNGPSPAKKAGASVLLVEGQDGSEGGKNGGSQGFGVGEVLEAPTVVLPEATVGIKLSASDLNRFICSAGEIKEALTSDEKGLMVKITGKDAFVKYKVAKRSDGKLTYSATPTEIYVVCGNDTYSMIAYPSRIPSQTIRLSSGRENRIKENQALYSGMPFEKRVMRLIKEAYTDSLPDSYTILPRNEVDPSWREIIMTLRREVDVEGEGMHLKEYHLSLKQTQKEPFKLSEKMFLRKEVASNPLAVSIDKHVLRPGDVSRLFIVEQRAEQTMGKGPNNLFGIDGSSGGGADTVAPQASAAAPAAKPKPQVPQNFMPQQRSPQKLGAGAI